MFEQVDPQLANFLFIIDYHPDWNQFGVTLQTMQMEGYQSYLKDMGGGCLCVGVCLITEALLQSSWQFVFHD